MAVDKIILELQADVKGFKAELGNVRKELDSTQKKVSDTGKNATQSFNQVGNSVRELGTAIGVAFGVQQLIQFGKASVGAYVEAERNAKLLLFALNGNVEAQQRLIEQSSRIQKTTIYSDDQIHQAQTFLANQGMTEQQITKTIDAAIQLATVTGGDLQTTTEQLSATYEGSIGRLGKLDSGFKTLTKEQLANGAAVDLVINKYQGLAEAAGQTTAGQLAIFQNQIGDLQEEIGQALLPTISKLVESFSNFIEGIDSEDVENFVDVIGDLTKIFLSYKAATIAADLASGGFLKTLNATKAAMATNPFGLFVAAITTLATLLPTVNDMLQEQSGDISELDGNITKLRETEEEEIITAKRLFDRLKDTNAGSKERSELISEINGKYGTTLKNISDEAKFVSQVNDAYNDVVNSIKAKIALQINEEKYTDLIKRQQQAQMLLNIAQKEYDDLIAQGGEGGLYAQQLDLAKQKIDGTKQSVEDLRLEEEKLDASTKNLAASTGGTGGGGGEKSAATAFELLNKQLETAKKLLLDNITTGKDYYAQERKIYELTQQLEKIQAEYNATISSGIKIQNEQLVPLETTITFLETKGVKAWEKYGDAIQKSLKKQQLPDPGKDPVVKRLEDAEKLASGIGQVAGSIGDLFSAIDAVAAASGKRTAEFQKALTLFTINLKLAESIANVIANITKESATPFTIAANIISGVAAVTTAIAQSIAVVNQSQVPEYAQGTAFVGLNGNPKGIDTIPAYLNEGEAVIPTEMNKKYPGLASSWIKGNLDEYIMSNWIAPAIEQQRNKDLANNIAEALKINGMFDDYRLYRSLEKNSSINQSGFHSLAKAINKNHKKRGGYA